jgi:hypothetical protein
LATPRSILLAAELFRWNVEARDPGTGRPDRPSQISSLAWLAHTLSELGQLSEGRRYGEEALRQLGAMEMTFWLPQAEATLAEVEGR